MDVATSPMNDLKRAYPLMELRPMTRGELSRFSTMETSTSAQTVVDPYLYLMLGGYEVQSKCGIGSTSSSSSSSSWYLHWVEPLLKSDVGIHFLHLNDDIFLPSPHHRHVGGARQLLSGDNNDELKQLLSRLKGIDERDSKDTYNERDSKNTYNERDSKNTYNERDSKNTYNEASSKNTYNERDS